MFLAERFHGYASLLVTVSITCRTPSDSGRGFSDVDCGTITIKIMLPDECGDQRRDLHPNRHRRLHRLCIVSLGIADETHIQQGNTWDKHD